jgi:hypothetical protein
VGAYPRTQAVFDAVATTTVRRAGKTRRPNTARRIRSAGEGRRGGHRASGRIRVDLVEKRPQSRDVIDGVGRKNDHPILRGRPGQFIRRTPARNPGLGVIERNSLTVVPECVETAPVLGDIGTGYIDHGIQQSYGLGQNRSHVLPALGAIR